MDEDIESTDDDEDLLWVVGADGESDENESTQHDEFQGFIKDEEDDKESDDEEQTSEEEVSDESRDEEESEEDEEFQEEDNSQDDDFQDDDENEG